MAQHDDDIARAWARGGKIKRSWYQRVTQKSRPWGSGETVHGLYPREGTVRFGPSEDGTTLLSYGRWPVAVKVGKTIIVNGDNGPSMTTRSHQASVRDAVRDLTTAVLPFSALDAARIELRHISQIKIIATTPDREIEKPVRRLNRETGVMEDSVQLVHFLGETLFLYDGRYYVSGLDRNDDPKRRNFYLARLPAGRKPKTVDEALNALRPKGVPDTALRQGEWFLVPSDKRPKKVDVLKDRLDANPRPVEWLPRPRGGREERPVFRGVPVISAKPAEIHEALTQPRRFNGRGLRHVASRVYLNGAVYVSGMLRDIEHGHLKLGDGRGWFKVVRNLADGSWGATGDVD